MASKIDFKNPELSIYYHNIALVDFKNWIDEQIKSGKKTVTVEYDWGYYNDLFNLTLVAE